MWKTLLMALMSLHDLLRSRSPGTCFKPTRKVISSDLRPVPCEFIHLCRICGARRAAGSGVQHYRTPLALGSVSARLPPRELANISRTKSRTFCHSALCTSNLPPSWQQRWTHKQNMSWLHVCSILFLCQLVLTVVVLGRSTFRFIFFTFCSKDCDPGITVICITAF